MSPLRPDFSVEEGLDIDLPWDETRITALVRSIVERELAAGNYVIGLYMVGDSTIRALNVQHRAKDMATDVLSFPLQDVRDSREFALPPNEAVHLGDVVVSYETAARQADEYGHTLDREIAYLVAHGVLHVLGYDHEEEGEREVMRAREEEALSPLGFTR